MRDDAVRGRLDRLDDLLAERGWAAVWFARPNSFAWLTGGDNAVDRAADVGVAAAGYDGDVRVVTSNVEAERLLAEELPDGIGVETFAWQESSLAGAVAERSPRPAAADFDVPGFEEVDATPLRQPLTDGDVEAYRDLGATVAGAVESVCRTAEATDSERAVAARIRGRLAEHGMETPVALVGGGSRAQRYRHYTPTDASLGEYALVSVTARRGGLHASCTRTVAFDPPDWLADRHRVAARVEATALAATREADTAGEVFAAIQGAYAALGWPGEWRDHHQGGAAGFAGREWFGTPDSDAPVRRPMAYAWNPTVAGAKSEDTHLVGGSEDGPSDDGVEPLTATGDWPTESFGAVDAEFAVERPVPLRR